LMFSLDADPTLEAIGYTLDGWEALEYILRLEPDVVLVGPRLSGLDPFGFCRYAHELFPNVLLIMLCERLVPAAVESAYALGVRAELELAAVRSALGHLPDFPPGTRLSINVSPAVAITDAFFELVAPVAERLIVELTEHEPVDDYDTLVEVLANLRSLGALIA